MDDWSHPQQLVELAAFYEEEARNPGRFSDAEFMAAVEKAFWGTNCWSYVEAAFAIIAPACGRRPHLTRSLIKHPIDAMIAGGLDDSALVIAQGVACATKSEHYVEPTDEGKEWLLGEWTKSDELVQEVWQSLMNNDC
ncbi:MAG: hypothetical protein HS117_24040 [Verrucomicrobiaceae bacterium]|nr:hypothetical protein [Verrucomicrobiaceae bacterium]